MFAAVNRIAVALVLLNALAAAHDQVPGEPQSEPILLRGGTLYTVANGVQAGTDILFENGRITAIGTDLTAPGNSRVIDVSGQHVYPGLIAANTQLGLIEIGAVRATNDITEVGTFTPEAKAHIAFNPSSLIIPTIRSHGITTVQTVPGGSLVRGQPCIMHLEGWTKEDAAVEYTDGIIMTWPGVRVSTGWWVEMTPEEQRENQVKQRLQLRQLFADARAYHDLRATGATIAIDQRFEAMRQLFLREQPLYVGANDARQIVEAVTFANEYQVDLVIVGGREAHLVVDLLATYKIPVIIGSITATPAHADDPYDTPFVMPQVLHDAGVPFAISKGGYWNVRTLPLQVGHAIAFGLEPAIGLRAVTLSPAEILGIDDRLGSLEVGKEATLFVSDGDIFDHLTRSVTRMWIRGRQVSLDNHQEELYRKYQEKQRQWPMLAPE